MITGWYSGQVMEPAQKPMSWGMGGIIIIIIYIPRIILFSIFFVVEV